MMRSRLQLQELCDLSLVEKDSLMEVIRTWLGVGSRLKGSKIFILFAAFVNINEKDLSLCERDGSF
jgi:hypothetical protein